MLAADISLAEGLAAGLFQNERATNIDVFKNMYCTRS
jgi:hypothetical protein